MKKFILLLTVCALFTGCGMMNDIKGDMNPTHSAPASSPLSSPLKSQMPETLPEATQAPDNSTNENNPNRAMQ